MALERKPQVGDRLRTERGAFFWVRGFDGDICLTRDERGHESCFIWRFVRSTAKGAPTEYQLNTYFAHAPENVV